MLWLALGPFHAMENQMLVIRIKIPNSGAVDWTVHSGPQLLFRDVLVSGHLSVQIPLRTQGAGMCGVVGALATDSQPGDPS